MKKTTTTPTKTVAVTIEGSDYELENREYTGRELRAIADLAPQDKLVREEPDGTETPVPPGKKIRPKEGDNFFVSIRWRRG